MQRTTIRLRGWALSALALGLLAGCPPRTGRHRGEGSDGMAGLCVEDAAGVEQGGFCDIANDQCDTLRACGSSGTEVDSCTCLGNQWVCQTGPCNEALPDGGDPVCPAIDIVPFEPCTTRQGGLSCTGVITDCLGNQSMSMCYCTGTNWFCPGSGCDGGGPDANGCPDLPTPGQVCAAGLRCTYPGLACLSSCQCGVDGTFDCEPPCAEAGTDAGAFDASAHGADGGDI